MRQNRRFAVTGGIGSGKSTVLRLLEKRGFPVYSCDEISAELWETPAYRRGLARLFPACVRDGEPDKALLAKAVFSDGEARARLNAYAHPRIMEALLSRMRGEMCFAEVPLLFEGGFQTLFDGVIVVMRSEKARVRAVSARDGIPEAEVLSRMAAQFSDGERAAQEGCLILPNDGDLATLSENLSEILKKIG